ncbi:MAG: DnaJ C-terminal domain-containing protein [Pseudotabrizicola sp.]|uniref:DnaJ C-terminal domain-containing protein n=1 Tax=Pseudotabrizicola sp. TaxID=2939647 RepID=UPI002730F494|nr:DnaJ C-terminal domain-containing protein [Pseudotabrizicola sp.]MDP2079896.1 DnaJ C-terminal domain-containing protein [Pseudotabrizicola sp.]MDZ7573159.1 DnaJ C-terminal domain-containing protein [Pseudotabrizicola sp.]
MSIDPYKALGLTKSATADEIKKAYRKLVRTSHPDLHPDDAGAEARFKAISAAYDLLKDPETRARFDTGEIDATGAERPQRQYYRDFAESTGSPYQQGRGFDAQGDPADIFAEILRQRTRGGSYGSQRDQGGYSVPGHDVKYALEVPFLDAARGGEMHITLPDGSSISVKIPQGARDGQTLRLRGKGGPGYGGGSAGDALIALTVSPHPVFRRENDDILLTLPITIDEAVLGGKVVTPTIDGPVTLSIPKGANSGRILRMRGRGVARAGGKAAGDQLVELRIVAPPSIDDALRDFLNEWRETHAYDPRVDLLNEALS